MQVIWKLMEFDELCLEWASYCSGQRPWSIWCWVRTYC